MLDFSVPEGISVLINGVECYPNIVPGSAFEWSLRDLDKPEPLVQIGELELALPDTANGTDLDLNPVSNSMLAVGALVQAYWGGSLRCAARIKQVDIQEFFPCTLIPSRITIALTDKLDIALGVESKSTPPVNKNRVNTVAAGSVSFSLGSAAWFDRAAQLISSIRGADGERIFAFSDVVTAGLDPFLSTRDEDGNPRVNGFETDSSDSNLAEKAARIAALRGYYLFCDENEQVRFILNPDSYNLPEPVLRLDCASADAVPTASLAEVPTAVEATSATLRIVVEKIEWPKIIETTGPIPVYQNGNVQPATLSNGQPVLPVGAGTVGVVERETRNRPTITSDSWLQVIQLAQRRYLANPDLGTTMMSTVKVTRLLKDFQGKYLKRETERNYEARTFQDKDAYPDNFGIVAGSNRIIEYRLKTRIVDGETKTYFEESVERNLTRKFDVDSDTGSVTSVMLEEKLITEWTELGRNSWRGRKRRYISRGLLNNSPEPLDYSLVPDPNFKAQDTPAEAPPEPPVREPEEEVRLSYSRKISSTGQLGKTKYIFIEGLDDPASLARYSQNNLLSEQQYRLQVDVARQVYPDDTVLPFAREDIHTHALLRDGIRIEFEESAMSYRYTGYPVAVLSAPVAPVYPPPYDFSTPPAALTVGPYSTVETTPNSQAVPLPLAAYGGTLPYAFSVIGVPGPGVYVSGAYLIVGGLAEGSYSFTLRVTDNDAVTADTTINVLVAQQVANPIYTLPPEEIDDLTGSSDTFVLGLAVEIEDYTGSRDEFFGDSVIFEDETESSDRFLSIRFDDVTGMRDVFCLFEVAQVLAGPDNVINTSDDVYVPATPDDDLVAGSNSVSAGLENAIP